MFQIVLSSKYLLLDSESGHFNNDFYKILKAVVYEVFCQISMHVPVFIFF